jgi:putative membrane protein insertion efficiency factor
MVKKLVINFLLFYKKFISPALVLFVGTACRFTPTCSEYSFKAIKNYGVVKGGILSIERLLRCNPLSGGYFDPVPKQKL